jgi:hypothetical protein
VQFRDFMVEFISEILSRLLWILLTKLAEMHITMFKVTSTRDFLVLQKNKRSLELIVGS